MGDSAFPITLAHTRDKWGSMDRSGQNWEAIAFVQRLRLLVRQSTISVGAIRRSRNAPSCKALMGYPIARHRALNIHRAFCCVNPLVKHQAT